MARPIKATPILYGKAARRFEQRMLEEPKETPEERERRLRDYRTFLAMMEDGKKYEMAGEGGGMKSAGKVAERDEGAGKSGEKV